MAVSTDIGREISPVPFVWLDDNEYQKAVSQLKLQLNGVFDPFRQFGQNIYIVGAVNEIVRLAEDFGLRVRGLDHPISLELIRSAKGKDRLRKVQADK